MINEKDFLDKLIPILERPGMFGIQKVEDISIIFFTEIYFHQNTALEEWNSRFNAFVKQDSDFKVENFHWSKIIRFYSGSDSHSIELFKALLQRFNEANVIH